MENKKSITEIKESIRKELIIIQECSSRFTAIFQNMPKEFAQELHDNYLGEQPTRAVLSGYFHGSFLEDEYKKKLLQILKDKFIDDSTK